MKYDFDSVISRYGTNSIKWDFTKERFGDKDILPMSIADMDFRAPQPVIDALQKVVDYGIFGYTGVNQSYYEAFIGWMKRRHSWEIEKDWVVISPGVMPTIDTLIQTFTKSGDQVIVQTPVYHMFFRAIRSNGCEILDNPLRMENGKYVMDLTDLENKINPRAKMILLCSPHNPVGRVWQEAELRKLGELCLKHNILVVSDEVHSDIVYKGYEHVPFASISRELSDNSITCTGVSKSFNLSALHIANTVISNHELRDRLRFHKPNMLGIVATEAAYRYGELWLEQLLEYLQGNVTYITEYIADKIPELKIIRPEGTYLLWLDFRCCGINPARLTEFLHEDAGVGLINGTSFGCKEDGFQRMNIACPRATLTEGLRRIEKVMSALKDRRN